MSVVKLVRRKIGREVYELPLPLIFGNSLRLIDDPEPSIPICGRSCWPGVGPVGIEPTTEGL